MKIAPDDYYPVINILPAEEVGAGKGIGLFANDEQVGSREKFWTVGPDGELWLYKKPRPTNHGEVWSEKVAAGIGHLIGVSCAEVQLAISGDEPATLCRSFKPAQWLYYHGNSVLAHVISGYDLRRRFGQNDHSVKNILRAISNLADSGLLDTDSAMGQLASYAILDGIIGNTDRHHENWMVMLAPGQAQFQIAPSYDHASSLGRELADSRRQQILAQGRMLNYIVGGKGKRGKGRIYADANRKVPLSPLRLAQLICRWQSDVVQPTLERLQTLSDGEFRPVIDKVPPQFMSDIAKEFAYQYLTTSKRELLRSIR